MDHPRFAPDYAVRRRSADPRRAARIDSERALQTGYEGLDEVEITLANEKLRWLDNPLFKLDTR